MASGQTSKKLFETTKQACYLSGDASTAKDITWVDMSGYGKFSVLACAAALTGVGVTVFKILANSASDGSGTDYEIKAHAVGSAPDAAGDWLVLECTAEEVAHVSLGTGRYVTANITAANAADNIACFYVLAEPRFAQSGLTADYVS